MESQREMFSYYMENTEALTKKLEEGEEKARSIGRSVLGRVKGKIGY
jgi:hypothetical protein